MAPAKRSHFFLGLGIAVLVLGIPFALSSTWDRSDLGKWIRELAAYHDIEVKGRSYRFSAMDGLALEKPTVRFSFSQGEVLLNASNVNVELNWPKLLQGKYWCEEIHAQDARITFLFQASGEMQLPKPKDPDRLSLRPDLPRCEPETITFENATLVIRESPDREPTLVLEGLHLLLNEPQLSPVAQNPLKALDASGEFQAQTLRRGSRTYSDVEGKLDILDGKLEIKDLRFKSVDGSYTMESGTLDLAVAPPTLAASLSAELSDTRFLLWNLDIALAKALRGQLRCKTSGPLSDLSATGELSLEPDSAHLRQMPLIDKASRLALSGPRSPEPRGRWIFPFTLEGQRIEIRGAKLDTDALSLTLQGILRPKQDVDLRFDLLIPKAEVAGRLSELALSKLQAADSPAMIHIPGIISGTMSSPRIDLRKDDISDLAYPELTEYLRLRGVQETSKALLP